MNIRHAKHAELPRTCFSETIASYVSQYPQTPLKLREFGHAIDKLTLHHWLDIGYAVSDIRIALSFPLIVLFVEQVIGKQWEPFCKQLIADGQRYAEAVKDSPETRHSTHGGSYIWNIGHGVAGAVAELLGNDALRKSGMPPIFIQLFEQAGVAASIRPIPSVYH